jgi:hypothetical protein
MVVIPQVKPSPWPDFQWFGHHRYKPSLPLFHLYNQAGIAGLSLVNLDYGRFTELEIPF